MARDRRPPLNLLAAIATSIAATHDEGLIIAAPAQLEASRALALADAAKAARLDVAIRVGARG